MRIFGLLVASVFALAGCTQATPVTLTNRSGAPLENVVIAGSGFERVIGTIAAGATTKVQVSPSGESGLKLSFRSGARTVVLSPQGYFEGGGNYTVSAVVEPDLSATVNASLRY
jgi:hypothetical protein